MLLSISVANDSQDILESAWHGSHCQALAYQYLIPDLKSLGRLTVDMLKDLELTGS